MKNVLRWLFGPTFQFVPPGLPANLYGPGGSVLTNWIWSLVLAQGEITKFLHHAIEWENMLYLIYPYFWSHPSRWDFKKYLDHPDLMHRVFLKSGSARVVLTIRPGYEEAFVAFLETGSLNGVSSGPYLTIAQEMEAYAQTNYPGIQPANPVDNYRPLLSRRQKRAWHDMENLAVLLENYKTANGQYPTTAQGLAVLVPTPQIPVVPTNDPWGNPYHYKSPGDYADYDLASYGANGAVGGTGEDADITSWADASLIGTWFEYTPTTALDIAINDILPSA